MNQKQYKFKLTPAYCLYNGAAVIEQKGAEIKFLVENPQDKVLQQRLKNAFGRFLEYVVQQEECPENYRRSAKVSFEEGNRDELRKYVSKLYEADSWQENENSNYEKNVAEKAEAEAAAVLLLDEILNLGKECAATDIHIENNLVRFRVNGRLEEKMELVKEKSREMIQRIKLLAGMNVIEKRECQDGQFIYNCGQGKLFVRVSTMPVLDGSMTGNESVVMRLLDTERIPLGIDYLGFNARQIEILLDLASMKNGLVLFCGPTGAGKSTSAAAMLMKVMEINGGGMKIISLEEPPEYVIPGVCQIKIDEKNGSGFEQALQHVFRQDPDVIMIGEIRDSRSAEAAVRGAMTGHLVFGTVHAGGAGECLLRMENLGVDMKLLSSVVRGIVSQDLNYGNDFVEMLADVSVPAEGFGRKDFGNLTEEKLDELFIHSTNYIDAIKMSLRRRSKAVFVKQKKIIKKEA